MKFITVVIGALLITTCISVQASMSVPIPLKELYVQAGTVAVVEIIEGSVVASGGETCAAKYKGRVVEAVKGTTAGAVVEFGYLPSMKLGTAYLLLLGKFEDAAFWDYPDFHKRCRSVLPAPAILGLWRGAMEVEGDTSKASSRSLWTVHSPHYAVIPLGTRSTVINGKKQHWFTDLIGRMKDEK